MPDSDKTEVIVSGEAHALLAATLLITRSAWFEIVPYPDDEWIVRFKRGESHLCNLETLLGSHIRQRCHHKSANVHQGDNRANYDSDHTCDHA